MGCVPARPTQPDELLELWQLDRQRRRAVLKAVSARRAEMQQQQDNLSMFIRTTPPPPPVPPSVALLTALGYLQELHDREPVYDIDELATNAGLEHWEVRNLLLTAEEKGYVVWDDDDSIALTAKGWRWYEKHSE